MNQDLLFTIADRWVQMLRDRGFVEDYLTVMMDLEAAAADTPLDLARLVNFDDFNFAHDMSGIRAHLNRETGELEDCFLPRCAV